jgi:hypothetical protein
VQAELDFEGRKTSIAPADTAPAEPNLPAAKASADARAARKASAEPEYAAVASEYRLPLIALAHGRSGDKGNSSNIGILAREPRFVPLIGAALTAAAVARYMAHVLDPEQGRVTRYALPGCNGWNFLLENSLGGGGIASLRADAQGKAHAQQLLGFEVPVPKAIFDELEARAHPPAGRGPAR